MLCELLHNWGELTGCVGRRLGAGVLCELLHNWGELNGCVGGGWGGGVCGLVCCANYYTPGAN